MKPAYVSLVQTGVETIMSNKKQKEVISSLDSTDRAA